MLDLLRFWRDIEVLDLKVDAARSRMDHGRMNWKLPG